MLHIQEWLLISCRNDYFAAFIVHEVSAYMRNEELREYDGSIFLVIEFDDSGKIKHTRRYHQ